MSKELGPQNIEDKSMGIKPFPKELLTLPDGQTIQLSPMQANILSRLIKASQEGEGSVYNEELIGDHSRIPFKVAEHRLSSQIGYIRDKLSGTGWTIPNNRSPDDRIRKIKGGYSLRRKEEEPPVGSSKETKSFITLPDGTSLERLIEPLNREEAALLQAIINATNQEEKISKERLEKVYFDLRGGSSIPKHWTDKAIEKIRDKLGQTNWTIAYKRDPGGLGKGGYIFRERTPEEN